MPKKVDEPKGLLLATMEPPPAMEEEFQEWYDTEHFPEREGCEGFETAARFICIDGWPRYLAAYDLTTPGVLDGPAYAAIAGARYSRWTHRIMGKVWGQYRAAGHQIYPGNALLGDQGGYSRLVVWRFRQVPQALEAVVVKGMRKLYEGHPEVAQVRVFRSPQADGTDCLGLVEVRGTGPTATADIAVFGAAASHVDTVNVYGIVPDEAVSGDGSRGGRRTAAAAVRGHIAHPARR